MRLLGELSINAVGTLVATSEGIGAAVRGVSVSISTNDTDAVNITSGPTGSEVSHFQGRVIAGGGQGFEFGGPVAGPIARIEWQGTLDTKLGRVQFWDEPFPAFGMAPLAQFTEAGIGAGGISADFAPNDPGRWVRRTGLLWTGDQDFELFVRLAAPGVFPTNRRGVETASADTWAYFELNNPPPGVSFHFQNDGAGAGEVSASYFGFMT